MLYIDFHFSSISDVTATTNNIVNNIKNDNNNSNDVSNLLVIKRITPAATTTAIATLINCVFNGQVYNKKGVTFLRLGRVTFDTSNIFASFLSLI